MATPYRTIYRQVALRVNALTGTDPSALETSYTDATPTAAEIDSVIFTFSAIQDAILNAEAEIAGVVAGQTDHPYRSYLHAVTGNLADGAVIPVIDVSSNAIIGVPGAARDATDSTSLTVQPISVIKNLKRNTGGFYISDYYYYSIVGNRIRHTRTNVVLDVCIYDRSDQATIMGSNFAGNMVLPDSLSGAVVAGAVSNLVRDDEFANQAQIYRSYYDSALRALLNGGVHVPSAPAALTTTEASA